MKINLLLVVAALLFVIGCKSIAPAIDGNEAVVKILCDEGITKETDPTQARRLKEVGYWMSDELFKMMINANFRAAVVQTEKDYNPDAGEYLLKIKIDRYHFKPVGTFLDTSYQLIGKEVLVSRSHGCGTGRNWRNCCEKLNKDMLDVVAGKINELAVTNKK